MTVDITMPALSPTMTEGTLGAWLKSPGDAVAAGEALAEVEVDKATLEIEAAAAGVLTEILVPAGTKGVAVATVIGRIDDNATRPQASAPAAPAPAVSTPAPAPTPAAPPAPPAPRPVPAIAAPATDDAAPALATPLARRIATLAGIALDRVAGSGAGGRILKADVEALMGRPAPVARTMTAAPAAPAPFTPPPGEGPFVAEPLTAMRRVIAERLTVAKQSTPHFYLSVDCRVDALLAFRQQLQARNGEGRITLNDLVIKALALALRRHPDANAAWGGDHIRRYQNVDVAVAVAIEGGLLTPVIRRADGLGVAEIASRMRELAASARAGTLAPEDYQGGSVSLSNLGMYGIPRLVPILNPPQACILGVGAVEKRPVVEGDAVVPASQMTLTLSVDHRVVDGALGAQLLSTLRRLLESPIDMIL